MGMSRAALTDGVTGRVIDVLRRAASQAIADRTRRVGLDQLQYVGARLPTVIGLRRSAELIGGLDASAAHRSSAEVRHW
jgi:hypothetical protein